MIIDAGVPGLTVQQERPVQPIVTEEPTETIQESLKLEVCFPILQSFSYKIPLIDICILMNCKSYLKSQLEVNSLFCSSCSLHYELRAWEGQS